MKLKLPHDFLRDVREEHSFVENWAPLKEFEELYVPVGTSLGLSADPREPQEILDFLDIACTRLEPDMDVAYVFTDPERVDKDVVLASLPLQDAFERLFRNDRLDGILMNVEARPGKEVSEVFVLFRFALGRALGFLRNSDKVSKESLISKHNTDQLFQSFHIAASLRDQDAPIEDYFRYEADALFQLGLFSEAESYLEWATHAPPAEQACFRARLATLSDNPVKALRILEQSDIRNDDEAALFALEQGRALLVAERPEEALKEFVFCEELGLTHFDVQLGLGISYGQIAKSEDSKEFELARDCFLKVIGEAGFHRGEAYHHLGMLYFTNGEFDAAREAFEASLRYAPSPSSRKAMAICLVELGHDDLAEIEFDFLSRFYPELEEEVFLDDASAEQAISYGNLHSADTSFTGEEEIDPYEAKDFLKNLGFTLKGDTDDLGRIDSYINYFAPAGSFIESSKLITLDEQERKEAIIALTSYVASLLGISELTNANKKNSLFHTVIERITRGASSVKEEQLASLLKPSSNAEMFLNPFPTFAAGEAELFEASNRADRAVVSLRRMGLSVSRDISFLKELETALLVLREEVIPEQLNEGELYCNNEIVNIGCLLGEIVADLTNGSWHAHPHLLGYSVGDMHMRTVYPIWDIARRINLPEKSTPLTALETPIVCCQLIEAVKNIEVTTEDAVQELLARQLPGHYSHTEERIASMAKQIWRDGLEGRFEE